MPDARKRPCRICRRWFRPDVRVGDHQRACGEPDCRRARRQKTQAGWRARNAGYATAHRITQRNQDKFTDRVNATYKKHIRAVTRELYAVERPLPKPLPAWVPEVYRLHEPLVDVEGYLRDKLQRIVPIR